MIKIILVILFLMIPMTCVAEDTFSPKEMADNFFETITLGQIDAAYEQLFKGAKAPHAQRQEIAVLTQQTKNLLPLYGKVIDQNFLYKETIGSSIVRLVYILKLERHPTTWEFYFYKPEKNWFISKVGFNGDFQLLRKKLPRG